MAANKQTNTPPPSESSFLENTTTRTVFLLLVFLTIILGIAWVGVQAVVYLPQAVNSLATIAESVHSGKSVDLQLTNEPTIATAGEVVFISWRDLPGEHTYTFTYACTEGVSIQLGEADGQVMPCDTSVPVSSPLPLTISSERNRFTDIAYQVDARPVGSDTITVEGKQTLTVINAAIVTNDTVDALHNNDSSSTNDTTPPATDETPGTEAESEGDHIAPDTAGVTYIEEVVYTTPISNPLGYTDLTVEFLGVGQLIDDTFLPQAAIDEDFNGAIRFMVVNRGTKTSDTWSYVATLPSGVEYTSPTQVPLKPNERATITLGFEVTGPRTSARFGVQLTTATDQDQSNNNFNWNVAITE